MTRYRHFTTYSDYTELVLIYFVAPINSQSGWYCCFMVVATTEQNDIHVLCKKKKKKTSWEKNCRVSKSHIFTLCVEELQPWSWRFRARDSSVGFPMNVTMPELHWSRTTTNRWTLSSRLKTNVLKQGSQNRPVKMKISKKTLILLLNFYQWCYRESQKTMILASVSCYQGEFIQTGIMQQL